MASSCNPKGEAKRTAGIVSSVKEPFGFIDLLNKNLPISKVYFDFSSFRGSGDDLSKIFPTGTKVTLTFVESGGDHKVKHRAINLEKAQNTGQQTKDGKQERGGKDFAKHQTGRPNKAPNRQRSRDGNASHCPPNSGSLPGSSYPHETGASYPPPPAENPSNVDKIMGNALQFLNLADQMAERFISARAATMEHALAETKNYSFTERREQSGGNEKKTEKHNKQKKSAPPSGGSRKKAFSDTKEGKQLKAPLQCSEDSSSCSSHVMVAQESPAIQAAQSRAPSGNDQKKKKSRPKKGKLFSNLEANSFLQLLPEKLGEELRNKLTSLGLKSLNELILLRLTVGKKPTIRVFSNNDTSNHVLEEAENVDGEDLQRLLKKSNVVNMSTPQHYGVRGTLHSIRTVEQNGKITGATLFCQLHEKCDEQHGLEIIERKGLTAIIGDGSVRPAKFIYNYIREKTAEQAKTKDVLVLDVAGELSGCDDAPHASLGNVTRICCSSSSELPTKITESIDQMHECAVAINVDTKETLQTLRKMTDKGTQVIIEISPSLKSDISSVFGL